MEHLWVSAWVGGLLIGLSVSIMLLFNGRVTGISGIINGVLTPAKGDTAWRVFFVGGLFVGGWLLSLWRPEILKSQLDLSDWTLLAAGLLVGFGTVLGSGCTSGHGVCGFSRMSPRSLVATALFILAGMIVVALVQSVGG